MRICDIQECHSGGTCVALKSCWKDCLCQTDMMVKSGPYLCKVHPTMATLAEMLIFVWKALKECFTWNLFFWVPILEVAIPEPRGRV